MMNPDTREFVEMTDENLSKHPEMTDWKRFSVGERFELHGVTMEVRKITKKDVLLRPVKNKK
jgi:hypothetical protein